MDRKIIIGEKPIRIKESETGDFLSLTDLAKLVNDDSARVISKWIEMLKTIDFLDVWERNYNPKYDRSGYEDSYPSCVGLNMVAVKVDHLYCPKQITTKRNGTELSASLK